MVRRIISNFGKAYLASLGFVILVVPTVLSALSVYSSGGFDIAIFSQAVAAIHQNGHPFVKVAEYTNHLAVHFQPILYPIGWIYSFLHGTIPVYQYLLTLQFICVLGIFFTVLRNKSLQQTWFILTTVGFWGVVATAKFEFRPETLGAFCAIFSATAFLRRKNTLASVFLICAAMCGETFLFSACVLIPFLYGLESRSIKWAILSIGLGVSLGFLSLAGYQQFLIPTLGKSPIFSIFERYPLGDSIGQMAYRIIVTPITAVKLICTKEKLIYFLGVSLLMAAPITARIMIRKKCQTATDVGQSLLLISIGILAASPGIGKVLLSDYKGYTDFRHHYAADMMPGLLFTSIGFYRLFGIDQERYWTNIQEKAFYRFLTIALIAGLIPIFFQLTDISHVISRALSVKRSFPAALRTELRKIPNNVPVFANTGYVYAELAQNPQFLSPFTIRYATEQDAIIPQVLILGWPPDHMAHMYTSDKFDLSFRQIDSFTIKSSWKNLDLEYKLQSFHRAALPGDIWIWVLSTHGNQPL